MTLTSPITISVTPNSAVKLTPAGAVTLSQGANLWQVELSIEELVAIRRWADHHVQERIK